MTTKNKSKSVSLDRDVEEKMIAVCKAIGVNPHAYMVAAIGKTVQTDYLSFQIQQAAEDQSDKMTAIFESVLKDVVKEDIVK